MPANVETMMYVREKPWHGLGTMVAEAPTSAETLKLAGLNWQIEGRPVCTAEGITIPGYVANTRSTDGRVLGIVSDKYKVVQNTDAFAFTDSLIGGEVRYETAGSLRGGKQIWLLARMPEQKILGDDFEPYICFTNTHDGSGAVRACMTPIRVVCNNTLNLALNGAQRTWSTPHRGNITARLDEARDTLNLAKLYMKRLEEAADRLANVKMGEGEVQSALDELFPLRDGATERQQNAVEKVQDEIVACMMRPDVAQFLYTRYGFINAVSDFVGHSDPQRKVEGFEERRWRKIMNGHDLLDRAMAIVAR